MVRRILTFIILLLTVSSITGCAVSPTFLQPNSLVASDESNLYRTILIMAMVVFFFVEILLLYNIIRFRSRGDQQGEPRQKYGNWRLEFTWTAIPVVLVLILFILSVRTINAIAAPAQQPDDIQVHVIGHQWWWEFDYPSLGIITANELHVPTGKNVHLQLDSMDVIHSFWVPQLSHKIDVIPGQTNNLWFRAGDPGSFTGQCAEFCGLNHANMRILVVVDSTDGFNNWVAGQQAPPYQPKNDQEQKGLNLVTKGICSNCHTFGDNQSVNPIGPNLTHLMSRQVFAGAILQMNDTNLRSWLKDNQALKPGNDMKVNLSDSDIEALMAFLTQLK